MGIRLLFGCKNKSYVIRLARNTLSRYHVVVKFQDTHLQYTVDQLATYVATEMYFPFLVKCSATALDIANRQNAHNMTVAVRALVDVFRLMKRKKELDREILAFSVSHDHNSVRIYGHYPVIERDKTTFYRQPIREFYFTDGEEKWAIYKFTKNVYDIWMPILHKRICSAIDNLPPDIDFDISYSMDS